MRIPLLGNDAGLSKTKQHSVNHSAGHPARDDSGPAYLPGFRRGATLEPRLLCFVERRSAGSAACDCAAPLVASRRSSQAKAPWRDLAGIEHRVEAEFLRPVLLAESILPFRAVSSPEGVIPVTGSSVLDAQAAAAHGFAGLHGWLSAAESVWHLNSDSGGVKLTDRWNDHSALAAQFPLAPLRVVFAATGTIPAACLIRHSPSVIERGLYWSEVASEDEGRYLLAVLNAETTHTAVKALRARGLLMRRQVDKAVLTLPIPKFVSADPLHAELAATAAEAELAAADVEIPQRTKIQHARNVTRNTLVALSIAERIDWLVAQLLRG
jgi:hypothetical protein